MKVAALFVDPLGPYSLFPGVAEVYDEERDAFTYNGSLPVAGHSPCARWTRMAAQIEARGGGKVGDDGGAFEFTLWAVRTFGGVLEHPEGSGAWSHFGLRRPEETGEWVSSGTEYAGPAWTCYTEQSAYGHDCRKPTWLYAVSKQKPAPLLIGGSPTRLVESLNSGDPRRHLSPLPFAMQLLTIALNSQTPEAGRRPLPIPYRQRRKK